MNTIDLTPLYRSTIGFDRFGTLLNSALGAEKNTSGGYPPYNIEVVSDDRYAITVAVAGFEESDIDIQVENGTLTIQGKQAEANKDARYLHQGIANRAFERKFTLADHVEVTGAQLRNGLLTLNLVREVPEAMKPRKISINGSENVLEHSGKEKAA
ncbi:MAG: Hsp20 family protein [Acidiferrobacterales bacterium]|nr:Hsp20 family protein [Acidiferrobacterales bacterium]